MADVVMILLSLGILAVVAALLFVEGPHSPVGYSHPCRFRDR